MRLPAIPVALRLILVRAADCAPPVGLRSEMRGEGAVCSSKENWVGADRYRSATLFEQSPPEMAFAACGR